MRFREWFRPPRHVMAIFLAVAVVSAATLGWLTLLLLEQDKDVDANRQLERLEQAADRAAAVMQSTLADLELQLRGSGALPSGVMMVVGDPVTISVRPAGALLYYPDMNSRTVDATRFAEAERMEFLNKDLSGAAVLYTRLAADHDAGIRAGALIRLAAVLRKMRDPEAALKAYNGLLQTPDTVVDSLPAGLIARLGRASLFEENHRKADLDKEADALIEDFRRGRWRITRAQYEHYWTEASSWRGAAMPPEDPDALARAEAIGWLVENVRPENQASRRLVATGSGPALLIWTSPDNSGFRAIAAGPRYLQDLCHRAVPETDLQCTLGDPAGQFALGDAPASRTAIRTAAAVKLPWSLQVFSASGAATRSPRRTLLLSVLAVLTAVWIAGAYFIVRAIAQEMRVARLQSDFVAAVSHEFRSPLSSLCQISEMLAEDRLSREDLRRKSYAVLSREAQRLRRLVESLLDFGRFESGATVYRYEAIEIGAFLRNVLADFEVQVAEAGYRIEFEAPSAEVFIRADSEALARAVWNLLDNAVKYSPNEHTVWMKCEVTQNRVSIAVRDRGLGIPIHEQHEIFDRFVRGAESKALRIQGAGIGLAMVRHIAAAHGGEILLASVPGQGSTFTLILPAAGTVSGHPFFPSRKETGGHGPDLQQRGNDT